MVAHEETSMDMEMEMEMAGMANAFFTGTDTPLYSESWAPKNAGQYAGMCIFLIILAITLRAILTAKSFLDAKALESALKRRYVVVAGEKSVEEQVMSDASSMTGILTNNGVEEKVRIVQAPIKHTQPWRFSVDLPRALIMTVAGGVGYLLMLAVMSFNVGYFLSVLAGSFVGELIFGRFNQGAIGM